MCRVPQELVDLVHGGDRAVSTDAEAAAVLDRDDQRHQLLFGPNWIVNGSLKGMDEYAKTAGFAFEKPRQALAIVTPERGIVQQMPVYA